MSPATQPPAYVPTLTEIVHAEKAAITITDMQELMVQRVLQRVSLVLEKRLHEAAERLMREHAHALLPQLLVEIELVVRESVCEAFEREKPVSPV